MAPASVRAAFEPTCWPLVLKTCVEEETALVLQSTCYRNIIMTGGGDRTRRGREEFSHGAAYPPTNAGGMGLIPDPRVPQISLV